MPPALKVIHKEKGIPRKINTMTESQNKCVVNQREYFKAQLQGLVCLFSNESITSTAYTA